MQAQELVSGARPNRAMELAGAARAPQARPDEPPVSSRGTRLRGASPQLMATALCGRATAPRRSVRNCMEWGRARELPALTLGPEARPASPHHPRPRFERLAAPPCNLPGSRPDGLVRQGTGSVPRAGEAAMAWAAAQVSKCGGSPAGSRGAARPITGACSCQPRGHLAPAGARRMFFSERLRAGGRSARGCN
jgi:hypothetical protein